MTPEEVKEKRRQTNKAYLVVFNSPDGKVVLDDLNYRFNHRNDGTDAISMARYEGRRDVVIDIEEILELAKGDFDA